MRCSLLGIVFFVFIVIQAVSSPWSADVLVITQADNGKVVAVSSGSVIQVELGAKGGTGYLWEFEDLDRERLELISSDTKHAGAPGKMGTPVIQVWRLKAKETGSTQLQAYYCRPWEGKTAAIDVFRTTINITR